MNDNAKGVAVIGGALALAYLMSKNSAEAQVGGGQDYSGALLGTDPNFTDVSKSQDPALTYAISFPEAQSPFIEPENESFINETSKKASKSSSYGSASYGGVSFDDTVGAFQKMNDLGWTGSSVYNKLVKDTGITPVFSSGKVAGVEDANLQMSYSLANASKVQSSSKKASNSSAPTYGSMTSSGWQPNSNVSKAPTSPSTSSSSSTKKETKTTTPTSSLTSKVSSAFSSAVSKVTSIFKKKKK